MVRIRIPIRPAVKERPRFAKGRAFMSRRYRDWQEEFKSLLGAMYRGPLIEGDVIVSVVYRTPKGTLRGDLDNVLGGTLDALQPFPLANDRQVVELHGYVVKGDMEIDISIEPKP